MPTTIPRAILARAAKQPQAIAIVDGAQRMTYAELATQIHAAGRAMLAANIVRGDRIAIWAPNSARWIIAALGAQSIGAAMVPINTRYKADEAAYPLVKTAAKLLLCTTGFMGIDSSAALAKAHADGADSIRCIGLHDDADKKDSWGAFLAAGNAVETSQWSKACDAVEAGDMSDVMFTSGSTGRPKGVKHLHGPQVRQCFNSLAENGVDETDRYLIVNPFFHVFGYTGGWAPGLIGGCTVYPMPVFDVDQVLRTIQTERITYFPGPPTVFHSLLEHPGLDDFDVSSLRLSLTGSADVPVDLIQRMLDRLTFDRVIQAYGMTECGTATYTLPHDSAETVATTVGVACTDLEVRVVDPINQPVAVGAEGEIVVRGYAVMDGYLDDASATAATIDADGWLHTGDLGSCDERGYFRILGRLKDMLIVGGFNVYPAEVENIIRAHPDVEDVALIGVPDSRLGEVGCAFVIARAPIDQADFVLWCRERMANFKVPRHVEALEAFPTTASNKVAKVELREIAAKRQIGETG